MRQKERANQLMDQRRYGDLKKLCAESLSEEPEDGDALLYLGYASFKLGEKQGIATMQEALSFDPENDYYHYLLAVATCENNEYRKAHQHIDQAMELDPNDARYYCYKAQICMQEHKYSLAIDLCEDAIHLSPGYAEAKAVKAYCRAMVGNIRGAEMLIAEALADDPDDAYVNYLAGYIYSHHNKHKKARHSFGFSLFRNPESVSGQYMYLMSHGNWFTRIFFDERVLKMVWYVGIILCFIGFGAQASLAKAKSMEQVKSIPLFIALGTAYLYFIFHDFQPLIMVFFTKKQVRRGLFRWSDPRVKTIYLSLFAVVLAYIVLLCWRSSISLLVFMIALHVLLVLTMVFSRFNWRNFLYAIGYLVLFTGFLFQFKGKLLFVFCLLCMVSFLMVSFWYFHAGRQVSKKVLGLSEDD